MKTYIQTAIALILPFISSAQDKGIDQIIDEKFGNAPKCSDQNSARKSPQPLLPRSATHPTIEDTTTLLVV